MATPARPPTGRRITLADLAGPLGLDKSSVSLALRGSNRVSVETRERVVAEARRRSYAPNFAARQLSSPSAQFIGLVLPSGLGALAYEVVVSTIRELAALAAEKGMVFNILLSEDLVRAATGTGAYPAMPDGFCVWGDVTAGAAVAIASLGRPVVVLDPSHISYAAYAGSTIRIDNAGGGVRLAEHLLGKSVRRLLVVQQDPAHLGQTERWQSARGRWMLDRSIETLSYCLLDELSDAQLLRFCAEPDGALFCTNDRCALLVWHRLQRAGIPVPGQVRLAGFDADAAGQVMGLTTARPDWSALARAAFDGLREAIAHPNAAPASTTVGVTLIEGTTS